MQFTAYIDLVRNFFQIRYRLKIIYVHNLNFGGKIKTKIYFDGTNFVFKVVFKQLDS